MNPILEQFARAAADPASTARAWKQATGGKVIGSFPMHFPAEAVHAAGALPLILQEAEDPITVGHASFYPFFCGYTRSIVDQAERGDLAFVDAVMFGDHCVQVLSAADTVRVRRPELPMNFYQLIPSLRDAWSEDNSVGILRRLIAAVEAAVGVSVTEDALRASIALFNENRQLIRELYARRRRGEVSLTSLEMQHIVKSSMVMDKATHNTMLRQLTTELAAAPAPSGKVPVYLSGHLCQAPKLEVLSMIEECGAIVVDDDLYHGFRYVSTDVDDTSDPVRALARWYIARNWGAPCPTRIDPKTDWDEWLLEATRKSGAAGMIVLLAKYCEPHYYYYPRIKATFERADMPHVLIETEHELVAAGNLRTRIESFVEMIKRRAPAAPLATAAA
ncbi:MAG TPA: 2-hydroxyacyl-CoA dehydratase family protein [Ramlibacter sp.]|nr:2-hydroxyacyl-CoA dehydratase family protein [Ramlibacter sp.]